MGEGHASNEDLELDDPKIAKHYCVQVPLCLLKWSNQPHCKKLIFLSPVCFWRPSLSSQPHSHGTVRHLHHIIQIDVSSAFVLVTAWIMVSIAVMKHKNQKKPGRRIFLPSYTPTSQPIIKGSQVSNTRQETKGRNWSWSHRGVVLKWLVPYGLMTQPCCLCTILDDLPKINPTNSGLGPPTSIICHEYTPEACPQTDPTEAFSAQKND